MTSDEDGLREKLINQSDLRTKKSILSQRSDG